MHRRDMVRIGCLTGLGLGLSDFLQLRSIASQPTTVRAKSCILLWLDGGPSHLETFDLKPNAPLEVRGPFQSINTNVSGIQISELLPETAKVTDKIAIIRSMTSPLGEHGLANQYLLTGYKPSPVLQYPSFGSVLAHLRPVDQSAGLISAPQTAMPPYIAIPESRSAGAGFLGAEFEPFVTGGDPANSNFQVRDLDFYPGIDEARLRRRRDFLAEFNEARATFETKANSANLSPNASINRGADTAFEQAYRLITSGDAQQAFDLSQESATIRARYGPKMFGQSCLLARRLVQRGVPFVSVINTGWDTHEGLVQQLKLGYAGAQVGVGLIPTFDLGFAALISDLAEQGLLDETLVIAMGEFGRTPKLNTRGGRDHWPRVFSVVMAGGGVPGGQVIGASDRVGESPSENPISPSDLARTIYALLGIDPEHELMTSDGRPVPVNQGGKLIREIVGTTSSAK